MVVLSLLKSVYVVMLGIIHTFDSDAVGYLTATQEILVRSSVGTKGVKAFFHLLHLAPNVK